LYYYQVTLSNEQKWARDQVIGGPDDGLVPLGSADPGGPFFKSLGHTNNCHTNMFTNEELDNALPILLRR
jgi:hypothetical protein